MFNKFKIVRSQTDDATLDRVVNNLQDNIASALNPLVKNEALDTILLTNIVLKSGQTNVVNHSLGRKLTGWYPIRIRALAKIADQQDTNTTPSLTLLLICDTNVTIDLLVF